MPSSPVLGLFDPELRLRATQDVAKPFEGWFDPELISSDIYFVGGPTENGNSVTFAAGQHAEVPARLLDPTNFNVTIRVKTGHASTDDPYAGGRIHYWSWWLASQSGLRLTYETGSDTFQFERIFPGSSAAVSLGTFFFPIATTLTLSVWGTATQLGISVNGGAYTTASTNTFTPIAMPSVWIISDKQDTLNRNSLSEFYWVVAGSGGNLSALDSAALHANGNTDPTNTPGTPTFAWAAQSDQWYVPWGLTTLSLAPTVTSSATLAKQVGKPVTAVTTATPSLSRMTGKLATATTTSTPTLTRQTGKPLSATSTATSTLVRRTGKPLTATLTTLASLALAKTIAVLLTVTSTLTATLARRVGKPLAATTTGTASLTRQTGKNLTVTSMITASLSTLRVFLRVLTATVAGTATLTKRAGKIASVIVTATPSLVRQTGKTVSATVTSLATLTGIALRVFTRVLSATVTTTATIGRGVGKSFVATIVVAPTLAKRVTKSLTATVTGVASLLAEWTGLSALVTYFFDRPRPVGGTDTGTPGITGFEGSLGGGVDSGSPSSTSFDPPTPGQS